MDLTPLQMDLLRRLRSAVSSKPKREILYCTEWLGYLPYGLYHWMSADGQDCALPLDWSRTDLMALEEAGFLVKTAEWRNPDDELETKNTYQVTCGEP